MKFSLATSALFFLALSGVTHANTLRNSNNQRDLQQSIGVTALQEEINDLVSLIETLNARRQRRLDRGRSVVRLDRRIARFTNELVDLQLEFDDLTGGDDAPAPPADGELVTLNELAEIAVANGLTLDDFDDAFGARSVTELLSRTSTVVIRFNDFFRTALRRERAAIDQLRVATAASLGVQIDINAPPPPFTGFPPSTDAPPPATDAPPVTTTDTPPDTDAPPATDAPPGDGNGEVVTLAELAQLAIEAGMTLDDVSDTFGAISVTELLTRNSSVQSRFNDFFSQALRRGERADIEQLRRDTAASLGVQVDI